MKLGILNIKLRLVAVFAVIIALLSFFSCTDDLLYDSAEIGDGTAAMNLSLNFKEIGHRIESRAPHGGTPGNAIDAIESLCVLVYDLDGKLVKKYSQNDFENYNYKLFEPDGAPADAVLSGEHQAQDSTGRASFNIGVQNADNRLPYGKYRMYAVANMGDLSEYDVETETALHSITLNWNEEVEANNQMFGYFTPNENSAKISVGFIGSELTINESSVSLHAWIKRCVSKVTVAFDGRKLKDQVWIFLKSVEIKDIPASCNLAADNPDGEITDGDKGRELHFWEPADGEAVQKIIYHEGDGVHAPLEWGEYVSKGHPIFGFDSISANNLDLTYKERLAAQHTRNVNALYFFENMQGKGLAGTKSDKRQQVNQADKNNQVTSYPEGVDPNEEAWKDAKPYGSYIEVKAYYLSFNPGDPGQGEITYRFMLGKDAELDYNAQRNYHYKLTLCFNGYANDVDWHIEYEEEDRKIQTPNPYYISYLYNRSMMLPLDIDAGSATISSIDVAIKSNGWAPIEGSTDGGVSAEPGYDDATAVYWKPVDNPTAYPWNGFLSLRNIGSNTVITGSAPYGVNSNKSHYDDAELGYVTYNDFTPSVKSIDEAYDDGEIHVSLKEEEGMNHYTVNIPLWTRAKSLISQTGYTGNNPYDAYQREAKIEIKVTLSDGTVLTPGLSPNTTAREGDLISIRQVHRIVNPKGIYRSADKNADFHVVLMMLRGEGSTSFIPLPSNGPWRAYVFRDTQRGEGNPDNWDDESGGTIWLEGAEGTTTDNFTVKDRNGITRTYQTVNGYSGSDIDFTIHFNGKTPKGGDVNNYALIRVEYNNYTCDHLIFVRQGNEPDNLIENGDKWMASNNISNGVVGESPLNEGSLFRFNNWKGILAESNQNCKSPWVNISPNSFLGNCADNNQLKLTDGSEGTWAGIGYDYTYENTTYWGSQPNGLRVAEFSDYKELYDNVDIEQGFGILYGDDSEDVLNNIRDAYGYLDDGDPARSMDKGMRGCFVYNYRTGRNLFFPIGASGYGHRKADQNGHTGVLRYACSARWGYFPSSAVGSIYPNGVSDCPLFLDLFRRPGAIYWLRTPVKDADLDPGNLSVAWDINFFNFNFYPLNNNDVLINGISDACFIRSIKE